jgi:ribose transport system substrate-binding protein
MYSRGKLAATVIGATTIVALAGCSTGSSGSSGSTGSGKGASGGSTAANAAADSKVVPAGWKVGVAGTQNDVQPISKFCGTKPLTVALADGFGGNSWRKITRKIFEVEAAKCSNIKKIIYTDAQNDPQKAISDINSLVAQHVNVIVTFPDAGPALLPTIKKATAAGVKVVPFVATPGGTPGVDYVDFVAEDITTYGSALAEWTIKAMHDKGNLVMLGGIAGNSYSKGVYDGVVKAVKAHPGVKLLNTDGPVATDWEPGKTQQVVAGLITKYGSINGIVSDYGGGSVGGVRAFIAANKPLPVWSANDSNEFACLWYKYHPSQPSYQVATESSRNWVVAVALRKGLAAANGIVDSEPDTYNLQIIEDSTDATKMPKCAKQLPPDAILSSGLSVAQLKDLFK